MNTQKTPADQEPAYRPLALGVAIAAGVLAVLLRIVPHPTNFSSVGACSLFGGARVKAWYAYLLPLGVMVVSDLCLWVLSGFDFNYSLGHPSRVFVYASFMIYVWVGRWLSDKSSIGAVCLAGTLGGLQFFFVTNFCEWLFQPMYYDLIQDQFRYSRDLGGLATCFGAALPFYQGETAFSAHPFAVLGDFRLTIVWTILGDIVFTTGYLALHAKLLQRAASPEKIPVQTTNA
ncbi:MAG: hypothetical protein EXR98_05870 [Gemmataceae bacterium]|nr:hypothetical protein [Gemmataceae bacterium]